MATRIDGALIYAALLDYSPTCSSQLERIIANLEENDALSLKCKMIIAIKDNRPLDVFKIAGSRLFAEEEDKYEVAVLLQCATEIMAPSIDSCASESPTKTLTVDVAKTPILQQNAGFLGVLNEGNGTVKRGNHGINSLLEQALKRAEVNDSLKCQKEPSPTSSDSSSSVFDHSVSSASSREYTDFAARFPQCREKFSREAIKKLEIYFDQLLGKPNNLQLQQIANELATSEKRVKIWFKNRRAKIQKSFSRSTAKNVETGQCGFPNGFLNGSNFPY